MLTNFDKAVFFVLEHEGKLVNNPSDPGGTTNYGISLRLLKTIGFDVDKDGDVDCEDIRALTRQQAMDVYKKEFWDKNQYNRIKDVSLVSKIFDMSVNMGSRTANRLTQRALNNLMEPTLAVDGVLGKNSMANIDTVINEGKTQDLLDELRDMCAQFYVNLVVSKPSLRAFLNGWLRRASL